MLKVFSVFDSKAEAFLQPFFCANRAVALRSFAAAAGDGQSDFSRHAADFTLFEIGEWDPVKGDLVLNDIKCNLGTALQYQGVNDG